MPGGCPIDAALREYDHQPGPMRDAVIERQRLLERELQKAVRLAMETGELHKSTDAELVAFEIMGVVLAYYRGQQVVGAAAAAKRARAAFDRLIQSHSA